MNINTEILQLNIDVGKISKVINNRMLDFIAKANELVELSNDHYQIEKTLEYNKISVKGYVLESDCCNCLNDSNVKNYSIDELKIYLDRYEKQFNDDCSKYFLAITLYEMIENIEKLIDKKINLEIEELSKLVFNIDDIKNIDSSEYEELYNNLKNKLFNFFNSNTIDERTYNICIKVLEDIVNFYVNGYPSISEDYLYHDDN